MYRILWTKKHSSKLLFIFDRLCVIISFGIKQIVQGGRKGEKSTSENTFLLHINLPSE